MSVQIIQGNAFRVLELMPADSVDCVVTSPPYWGLRDYQTATWIGGDAACQHRSPTMREGRSEARPMLAGSAATNSAQLLLAHNGGICGICGARKVDEQIGLEATLGEHIEKMVLLFYEIGRVLKPTGTVWLNYGDAYAGQPNGRSAADTKAVGNDDRTFRDKPMSTVGGYLKPKDRMLLPARVAIALQEDGWWVRDEIIWHKPNPMPSSVKDRTTPAHEMIFLLTKSPRYYFDQEAIMEPVSPSTHARMSQDVQNQVGSARANAGGKTNGTMKAVTRGSTEKLKTVGASAALNSSTARQVEGFNDRWREGRKLAAEGSNIKNKGSFDQALAIMPEKRNKRSVWTVGTEPFSEAHFATFPTALIEPCILAGCPEGGVVLDPFGGAGTTGLVADRLKRNAILIELNPEYVEMARRRIAGDSPLFTEVTSK